MRIYIKTLEPLENRYTCQWKFSIPSEIKSFFEKKGCEVSETNFEEALKERKDLTTDFLNFFKKIEIVSVDGDHSEKIEKETKGGSFLNFFDTNIWKSSQLTKFCLLLKENKILPNDVIFLADAWDPTILQLKYMMDLCVNKKNEKVKFIGLWHAGSYDPNDFLGRIKNKKWLQFSELAFFEALDHNVFATNYHFNIFCSLFSSHNIFLQEWLRKPETFKEKLIQSKKVILSGQPHSILVSQLESLNTNNKENIVLFPHRIAEEKQLEIFEDLAKFFPDYQWIVCQKKNLSKSQYHELLAKSKLVFSANLQETLGIAVMEGILSNNQVLVPDRLSYREMYLDYFKYPSEWTENFSLYVKNREKLVSLIREKLDDVEKGEYVSWVDQQKILLKKKYLYMENLLQEIFRGNQT